MIHPCTTTPEIKTALRKAKPGDVIEVAPGTYGPIKLPRGKSGLPGQPITLRSAVSLGARIVAPLKSASGIAGGGCKHWIIEGFDVNGGVNGIQFSQNGLRYEEPTMIRDVSIRNCRVRGPREDGIKANGGHDVQVTNCDVEGGNDQGIDFLGIRGGAIIGSTVTCPSGDAGIIVKGGCEGIEISGNTVSNCPDGIHLGEADHGGHAAPWRDGWSARACSATHNTVSVRLRPIVFYNSVECRETGNVLSTAKVARGQAAPPVVAVGKAA